MLFFMILFICVCGAIYFLRATPRETPEENTQTEPELKPKGKPKTRPKGKPKAQKKKPFKFVTNKENPTHPAYVNCLKAQDAPFTDFCVKGGYLGTCAANGTLCIFKLKSPEDPSPLSVSAAFPQDEPTAVSLTLSGDVLVTAGLYDRRLHMFGVTSAQGKRSLKQVQVFPQEHSNSIVGLECLEKAVISCGEDTDTRVLVWSYSGTLLYTFDNKQIKNRAMVCSSNGRLLSITAWFSSARVIEIVTEKKTGEIVKLKPVMDLSGHTQALSAVGFDADTQFAVTCSLDGTVKLWNINVRYQMQENPKRISSTEVQGVASCGVNSGLVLLAERSFIRVFDHHFNELDVIEAHATDVRKIIVKDEYVYSVGTDGRINIFKISS